MAALEASPRHDRPRAVARKPGCLSPPEMSDDNRFGREAPGAGARLRSDSRFGDRMAVPSTDAETCRDPFLHQRFRRAVGSGARRQAMSDYRAPTAGSGQWKARSWAYAWRASRSGHTPAAKRFPRTRAWAIAWVPRGYLYTGSVNRAEIAAKDKDWRRGYKHGRGARANGTA